MASVWASALHRHSSGLTFWSLLSQARSTGKDEEVTEVALGVPHWARAVPPHPVGHMVPDLSAELLGNIFSVGVTAGLPTPELLLLLDRC